MKLARFGRLGEERPAIIDLRGQLRVASGLVHDVDVPVIEHMAGIDPEGQSDLGRNRRYLIFKIK
jgi:hypothetical protein